VYSTRAKRQVRQSAAAAGVEAGQIVTLTFTDSANHVVTTTTKVGSDGSWRYRRKA
jgi:plastocyanin